MDSIKLQIWDKVEKLKLFFAQGSLKVLNIFENFRWQPLNLGSKQWK